MQVFVFKARDAQGRIVLGKVASSSMRQIQKDIEKRGLQLMSLRPEAKWFDRISALSVGARQRSLFYRQLSTMLKAGISITQAIEVTANTKNKFFQRIIKEISLGLENGAPLSKCLENYPHVFPPVETGVIIAGEATGKLETVLKEMSDEAAATASFISKVRNAMLYPLFIVIVLAIVGVVVMIKVIPPINEIFKEQNVPLPLPTQILIGISNLIIYKWWAILLVIAVLIALFYAFVSNKSGRRIWHLVKLNFPIFGPLQQEVYLARFNRTFAMLLRAGVPIIQTVSIISTITNNVIYRDLINSLSRSMEQGAPIASTLQTSPYFPSMMTQLLLVGQQTGDLAGMCVTLADYYEEEVENKLKTFSALVEPFIIVVIGVAVAFVIVSILTPIYNLTSVYS